MKLTLSQCLRRRLQTPEISERKYFAILTLSTFYGLMVSAVTASYNLDWQQEGWIRAILYGIFVPLIGIYLARASDIPAVSFIGYTLRMIGLGVIIGPTFGYYHDKAILTVGLSTIVVLCLTSIASVFRPSCIGKMRTYLLSGLGALLCVRFAESLPGAVDVDPQLWYVPIVECATVTLFSLYVIYDWRKALLMKRTADNAIDCSLGIFSGTAFAIFVVISKISAIRKPKTKTT